MKIWSRTVLGAIVLTLSGVAAAQNAETTSQADVYAGPDDSYPVVARVDADFPLQVNGCLDDWSWCDVSFDGNRGWMYAPDIQYSYQGGYVPLYTYAPALGIAVVPFAVDAYWDRYYRGRPWYRDRDHWAHRDVHHRRPAGPGPSRTLPERPMRTERPGDNQPQRPMRLGSADRARSEGSADQERYRQQQGSPEQRNARPERAAPQDERAMSQQHSPPPQREERGANTQRQASPPREQHAPAEQHSAPPQREDRAPAARANERPNESRPNESRQNEPRQSEQRSEEHRDHPQ